MCAGTIWLSAGTYSFSYSYKGDIDRFGRAGDHGRILKFLVMYWNSYQSQLNVNISTVECCFKNKQANKQQTRTTTIKTCYEFSFSLTMSSWEILVYKTKIFWEFFIPLILRHHFCGEIEKLGLLLQISFYCKLIFIEHLFLSHVRINNTTHLLEFIHFLFHQDFWKETNANPSG